MPAEPAEFLTVEAAAALLGVHPQTVYQWMRSDPSIPTFRKGRVVRFHRLRLLDWVHRHESRAARRAQGKQHAA